jgi:CRISPR-associated protein Cas6
MMIDVHFPVQGTELATDHLYDLYAALSRVVPAFHDPKTDLRFGPVNGERGGKGRIRLFNRSRLRVRLPSEAIGAVMPLAGRDLTVGGFPIRLGLPTVSPLQPVTTLAARVVTYKHAVDPSRFLDITRVRLDAMGIRGEPGVFRVQAGERAGEPRRVVVRIKGNRLVGYSLLVDGLTAAESIRLQEGRLCGRTRMGCGFFIPFRPRVS